MAHAFFWCCAAPLRLWCSCAGAMVQGLWCADASQGCVRLQALRRNFSVLRNTSYSKPETRALSAYYPNLKACSHAS